MQAGIHVNSRKGPVSTVLDISGAVTAAASEVLLGAFRSAGGACADDVLLNFARVEHLDSAGISLVIQMLSEARQNGHRIVVCGLSPHYRKIFELMGLPQFAPAFDSEDEAQRWLQLH